MGDKVAVALFINITVNLSDYQTSIFRAELGYNVLLLAMDIVRRSRERDFITFSETKSSQEAINNFSPL